MSSASIVALVTTAFGIGFAVIGVVKYSHFVARLQNTAPDKIEVLTLETTENWSKRNWQIGRYFWQRAYLGDDAALNSLGNSVRRNNLVAIVLLGIAGAAFLYGGSNG